MTTSYVTSSAPRSRMASSVSSLFFLPLCSLLLFLPVTPVLSANRQTVLKRLDAGEVRGFKERVLGREIEHYLGIPFAKPPINHRRYSHSEKVEPWSGVRDATKLPPACYQPMPLDFDTKVPAAAMWLNNTPMSEDCLYLNVWRPLPLHSEVRTDKLFDKERNKGLAVMVWIFGGGFFSGSSTLEVYNGAYLAAKTKVVVVSMQYRVGPLGFLSLGNKDVPGNQGLMDQVLALTWVRDNIHFLGGDPNLVTLFGESAGAASVSLHLLSPLSQNLFKQAIMQSASALCNWAVESQEIAVQKAHAFAVANGCYVDLKRPDAGLLADCLRGLEPRTLTERQYYIHSVVEKGRQAKLRRNRVPKLTGSAALFFDVPFKPIVDKKFLIYPPEEVLRRKLQKRARIMLGVNKDEGVFYLMYGLTQFFKTTKRSGMFELPSEFYSGQGHDPADFVQQNLLDKKYLHPLLIQPVLFEYQIPTPTLGRRRWTPQEVLDALDDMAGDFTFKCPVIDFAEMYAHSRSDVYLYSFEERTKNCSWPEWTGVMHGYEIEYVFGMPYSTKFQKEFYSFTKEERKVADQMMKFWSNFAYSGNPNINPGEYNTIPEPLAWPRYTTSQRNYIVIKSPADRFATGRGLRRRECLFWSHHMYNLMIKLRENQKMGASQCPAPYRTTGSESVNANRAALSLSLLLLFSQRLF